MEIDMAMTPVDEQMGADKPNKRRRKKSIVWDHFTIINVGPGNTRACCNHCKKSFAYITGSKLAGTSHLKRHIDLGICPVSRQKNQQAPNDGDSGCVSNPPKRRYRSRQGSMVASFDQNRCNHDLAKMIIQHNYPLDIVEHTGFIDFVRTLQPQFNMVSFNAIQEDCMAMYLREKQNLLDVISRNPGRVNLTLDLWTSDQTLSYVFIRGHFIDSNWNLHRPILNVLMVPFQDSDDCVSQSLLACLSDWHLEDRLFTLTFDKCLMNDSAMGNLRRFLSFKNTSLLNGQLLIGNCYARVLSHLAQDALWPMREIVSKVRESVKFIKTSESHEEKFFELKEHMHVPSTKCLSMDDQTKWNSTFHMLVAACELKEVFLYLDTTDSDYRMIMSMDEWKQGEKLCTYLKYLFDAANVLTSQPYPTVNTFFPEMLKLQMELTCAAMSQDLFISNLIRPLQENFDRYWRESCLMMAAAVVMDPRFKMKLVEFTFSKIFGENGESWVKIVDDSLHELFLDYMTQALSLPAPNADEEKGVIRSDTSQEEHFEGSILSGGDGFSEFEIYISEITRGQEMKSELDQYLEESLLPRSQEFDILSWWRLNRSKYPALSRMAADILSVPVSTVSADSVFDTEIRKLETYQSSLHPNNLEALICTKDWFEYGSLPLAPPSQVSNDIIKMEF